MNFSECSIEWPKELGKPQNQNHLFGMGLGKAFEMEFSKVSAIVKISSSDREKRFYEHLSSELNRFGISTPKLLWATSFSDNHLIVIEKIPNLLPKERWQADDEVLEFLARMHECKIALSGMKLEPDHWTQDMNIRASKVFDVCDQDEMLKVFESLRINYSYILDPEHIISGDPNGRNWGIRENGELVLFDWERVAKGTASLDLMGVAFGEPEDEVFLDIARIYLKYRSSLKKSVKDLARETQVARVHITAVLLSNFTKNLGNLPKEILPYYKDHFPLWLRKTFL